MAITAWQAVDRLTGADGYVSRKRWPEFRALRAIAVETARAWAIEEHASALGITLAVQGWKGVEKAVGLDVTADCLQWPNWQRLFVNLFGASSMRS